MRLTFNVKNRSVPASKAGPVLGPLRIQTSAFNQKVREFADKINMSNFMIVLDVDQRTGKVDYSVRLSLSKKIQIALNEPKGLGKGSKRIQIVDKILDQIVLDHFGELNESNRRSVIASARSAGFILQR